MGQCKRCNQIYGAHEMVNGICKNCLTGKDKETINKGNLRRERSTTSWFIIFSLITLFLFFILFIIYFFKNANFHA